MISHNQILVFSYEWTYDKLQVCNHLKTAESKEAIPNCCFLIQVNCKKKGAIPLNQTLIKMTRRKCYPTSCQTHPHRPSQIFFIPLDQDDPKHHKPVLTSMNTVDPIRCPPLCIQSQRV